MVLSLPLPPRKPVQTHGTGSSHPPVEHILHRQHGDNGEDLVGALQVDRHDEHLGKVGLQRELCHPPPQPGQQPLVIQGTVTDRQQ